MAVKTVNEMSIRELEIELEKRKAIEKAKDAAKLSEDWPDSPVGIWVVSTEGDIEGRTRHQLGSWEGHIMDIAAALAPECLGSLEFSPGKRKEELPKISSGATDVSIQLDFRSGTWDMDSEIRDAIILEWLQKEDPEWADYQLAETNPGFYSATSWQVKRSENGS